MGMGKTLQMIGLIVTSGLKPNLILCPTVAILQWYAEFNERLVKDRYNKSLIRIDSKSSFFMVLKNS
jgi:SNF2 family DNA or RNA helicase